MGNFEKLVVLTVLFLAAIILGVTLHDDGTVGLDDPLGASTNQLEKGPSLDSFSKPRGQPQSNRGALSSLVEKEAAPKQPIAQAKPKAGGTRPNKTPQAKPIARAASLFKTTAGLTKPEFGEEYMIYTWRSGDTIAAVAGRYYGDRKLRYLIRNNNEDAAYRVGDAINLPSRDTAAGAGTRPAFEPAPAHATKKTPVAAARAVQSYTVQDGDNLWSIAKSAYGKGTQWEQIFKANRDQLDEPSNLRPGMVLRIP